MEAILGKLVTDLAPILVTLVTALVGIGVARLNQWLKAKSGTEALNVVGEVTGSVVSDLAVTVANDLKKAASDGKLTKDEISMLRNQAAERVKAQLPAKISKMATKTVGDLTPYILGKIEQVVKADKK